MAKARLLAALSHAEITVLLSIISDGQAYLGTVIRFYCSYRCLVYHIDKRTTNKILTIVIGNELYLLCRWLYF